MPYSKDIRFAEDICDLPDYLDARDISKRLAELEDEKAECEAATNPKPELEENDEGEKAAPSVVPPTTNPPEWDEDKESLLVALREMVEEECESWVSDNEWVNYCRELAYDCGMLGSNSALNSFVDWEGWAEECARDYTEVQAGATVYYGR